MKPFAIAGMQLQLSGAGHNLAHMQARLDYLMHLFPWVQMVVYSELAAHGPSPAFAEPVPGPTERSFQEMAAKHAVWLVAGSIFERVEDHVFNTASVIDPEGRVIGRISSSSPMWTSTSTWTR